MSADNGKHSTFHVDLKLSCPTCPTCPLTRTTTKRTREWHSYMLSLSFFSSAHRFLTKDVVVVGRRAHFMREDRGMLGCWKWLSAIVCNTALQSSLDTAGSTHDGHAASFLDAPDGEEKELRRAVQPSLQATHSASASPPATVATVASVSSVAAQARCRSCWMPGSRWRAASVRTPFSRMEARARRCWCRI